MATTDLAPPSSTSITYSSGPKQGTPALRLLHYNDVYHVEPGTLEPVGGISRFKTLCDYYQSKQNFPHQPGALTFFSGDAYSPSLESSVTKGKHMLDALNSLNTNVACLGNHDLDFGVEQFMHLADRCNFPWLCANVLDPALGEGIPLGNCKRTVMLESSNGIKVGVVGVVEQEWLDTINILPPNLRYLSSSATVAELAPILRAEGAEMVVVIAHQRELNDNKLASELKPGAIDLILGGHDHYYAHSIVNGTHVLRSGSDFKQLSYLECRRKSDPTTGWDIDIVRRDIVGAISEEAAAVRMVAKITESLRTKLEKPVGYTAVPLDARFTTVRLQESNIGNFICDLMRFYYSTDCCIMGAGTLRADQIYLPGLLRVKDVMNLVPFEDPCVVIALKGERILEALENGVSNYPALEGRFPQVSGINFAFDPQLPSGKRCSNVRIGTQPLIMDREYSVATRDFMVRGRDGYASLMLRERGGSARSIVSSETGILISMLLRHYFMSIQVLGKWKRWSAPMEHHWDEVHEAMHAVQPVCDTKGTSQDASPRTDTFDPDEAQKQFSRNRRVSLVGRAQLTEGSNSPGPVPDRQRRRVIKFARIWIGAKRRREKGESLGDGWTRGICPKVEGRIVSLGSSERPSSG